MSLNTSGIMKAILHEPAEPISKHRQDIPRAIELAVGILQCDELEHADLEAALRDALDGPPDARPAAPTSGRRTRSSSSGRTATRRS